MRNNLARIVCVLVPLCFTFRAEGLSGPITDASGSAVASAAAVVTAPDRQVKVAFSGIDGRYEVADLAEGRCTVRVNAQGFRPAEARVDTRVQRTLNLRLERDAPPRDSNGSQW